MYCIGMQLTSKCTKLVTKLHQEKFHLKFVFNDKSQKFTTQQKSLLGISHFFLLGTNYYSLQCLIVLLESDFCNFSVQDTEH